MAQHSQPNWKQVRAEAEDMIRAGASDCEISQRLGIIRQNVTNWRHKLEGAGEIRPRREVVAEQADELRRQRQAAAAQREATRAAARLAREERLAAARLRRKGRTPEAERLFLEGHNTVEVADILGISKKVAAVKRQRMVQRGELPSARELFRARAETVRRLVEEGAAKVDVAKALGISEATVYDVMSRQPRAPGEHVVYFVLDPDRQWLKIGTSNRLPHRMKAILAHNPAARLLLTTPGDRRAERALHERFSALRIDPGFKCEWFRYEGPLVSYVESLMPQQAAA